MCARAHPLFGVGSTGRGGSVGLGDLRSVFLYGVERPALRKCGVARPRTGSGPETRARELTPAQ